jgi:MSHA biogenesis protein MshI
MLGVVASGQGLYVASGKHDQGLLFAELPVNGWQELGQWCSRHKIDRPCLRFVLDVDQHLMLQVEKPNAPEEELHALLLLNIRDRIDYPVNECQVDYFPLPPDVRRSQERVNVVAAPLPLLESWVAGAEQARASVDTITVPELALGDLCRQIDAEAMERGICLLIPMGSKVTLLIYRQDYLYMTRTISGLRDWEDYLMPDNPDIREALLLEIQRTLDYYQTQMQQPPVAKMLLPDWINPLDDLAAYLNANLAMNVDVLNAPEAESVAARRGLTLAHAALLGGQ